MTDERADLGRDRVPLLDGPQLVGGHRRRGGPHAVPVWGVVVAGELSFYGEDGAVRSRNLALDPRLVLHLEDGDAPLIVHGRATSAAPPQHAGAVAAYAAKYTGDTDLQYLPGAPEHVRGAALRRRADASDHLGPGRLRGPPNAAGAPTRA